MTASDTTHSSSSTQAKSINPRKFFSKSFDSVLNTIQGTLTFRERKLLSFFAFLAYEDGQIFPKRTTIAHQLGVCKKQVTRLIAGLEKKGFLLVHRPSTVERHVFRKPNRYELLYHPVYDHAERSPLSKEAPKAAMSPEMSPQNSGSTFNFNKSHKTTKDVSFKPEIFREEQEAKGIHPKAIDDALHAIATRWESIRFPWAYAAKVVACQSGRYHAEDGLKEHEERKRKARAPAHGGFTGLLQGLTKKLGGKRPETRDQYYKQQNDRFAKVAADQRRLAMEYG